MTQNIDYCLGNVILIFKNHLHRPILLAYLLFLPRLFSDTLELTEHDPAGPRHREKWDGNNDACDDVYAHRYKERAKILNRLRA